MKPLKTKVSITIDEDVTRRLRELAEADDRSLSQYINLVLKNHLILQQNTQRQLESDLDGQKLQKKDSAQIPLSQG